MRDFEAVIEKLTAQFAFRHLDYEPGAKQSAAVKLSNSAIM